MSDVKQAPVTQQPQGPVDGPAYKQVTAQTGAENWSSDIFDCFTGDDNLYKLPVKRSHLYFPYAEPKGN